MASQLHGWTKQVKTALIVDADLDFGFWLGRGLDQTGYQSFPAKSAAEATAMLDELRVGVDLLILDPALPGAAQLVQSLRSFKQELKVVALIGDQQQLPGIAAPVDLCCRRPERTEGKRLVWIAHVEEMLPVNLLGAAFRDAALLRICASAAARYTRRKAGGLVGSEHQSPAPVPSWRNWEGRVLGDRFRLDRYLGSSNHSTSGGHSAMFLTRLRDEAQQTAAVRVVVAGSEDREILRRRWERAAALSHPGLVRLFDMGSCEVDGTALVYLVMESAEENLEDVLRQRPLTPAETHEMLDLVLKGLDYIHSHGFVHSRLRPSNILGVADQLKISSDALRTAGEQTAQPADASVYDAPEITDGCISPAADIWSLGITLVEALTQHPPIPKRSQRKMPTLPGSLPPEFLNLAQQCLQPDPSRRQTIVRLAEQLSQSLPTEDAELKITRPSRRLRRYAVPAATLALAAASAMLFRPLWQASVPGPAAVSLRVPAPPLPVAQPQAGFPSSGGTFKSSSEPASVPTTAVIQPASLKPNLVPPIPRKVTHRALPDVSQQARATIRGTVRVQVRAQVDSSGHVMDATLESPGPSRYFANRSLEAARKWKFAPLADVSPSSPEEWMLRFEYTTEGIQVSAQHVTP